MTDLSYVFAPLKARHRDRHPDPRVNEGLHEHTWTVTAYFGLMTDTDKRELSGRLVLLLERWHDEVLPSQLAWDEGIARMAFNALLPHGVVGVRVERGEGFGATLGTCA
jgi:hypothetical protein